MEIKFEKNYLSDLYYTGKTNDKKHRFQPQIIRGYAKCVKILDEADNIEELYPINSLNYKKLEGNKKGLSSVRISVQYRLEFREVTNNEEKKVEILSLVDITNHYK